MQGERKKLPLIILGILLFQILYYQLTLYLINLIMADMPYVFEYFGLMIHHTIQFALVFIPTLLLHRAGKIDFGYHIKDINKVKKYLWVICAFSLFVSLFQALRGAHMIPSVDYIIFQLFFSGLGEEIAYRAIPIALLCKVSGKETRIHLYGKVSLDYSVLISALFFSIAHISFQFGSTSISYSWIQLLFSFFIGLILGSAYKKVNSIWYCMFLHGLCNIVTLVFPLIFSII